MASVLSVIYLGDANGVEVAAHQKAKLAAIEAEWTTQKAPAPWSLVAIPHQEQQKNSYSVELPWALGVLVTHSLDTQVEGLKPIIAHNKIRIRNGIKAYAALEKIRHGDNSPYTLARFNKYQHDLGYGLLVKRYTPSVVNATEKQINLAAKNSIPNVPILFWSFRFMVGLGFYMLWLFIFANIFWLRDTVWKKRWLLRIFLYSIPIPWISTELGWVVAEMGRQPWVVNGILPTFLGTSNVSTHQLHFSLIGFIVFYTGLLVVELFLMFKYARLGPSSLSSGRYHFENPKLGKEA